MTKVRQLPNDQNGRPRFATFGKLTSYNPNSPFLTANNERKTKYKVVTVDLALPNGEKTMNALLYEGNIKRAAKDNMSIEEGKAYLCTVTKGDERGVIVQMSHLPSGGQMSNEEFDAIFAEAETAPAATEQEMQEAEE